MITEIATHRLLEYILKEASLHILSLSPGYLRNYMSNKIIYLFGVLRRFQHCTGHIMSSWKA